MKYEENYFKGILRNSCKDCLKCITSTVFQMSVPERANLWMAKWSKRKLNETEYHVTFVKMVYNVFLEYFKCQFYKKATWCNEWQNENAMIWVWCMGLDKGKLPGVLFHRITSQYS